MTSFLSRLYTMERSEKIIFGLLYILLQAYVIVSQSPINYWTDIACGSQGKGAIAVYVQSDSQSGFFATKTFGQSWSDGLQSFPKQTGQKLWATTAMNNGSGLYQAIAVYQQNIYFTNNAWINGSSHLGGGSKPWNDVAISSSGQLFVAASNDSFLYYSKNYGQSWTAAPNFTLTISTVAINSAGDYIVAGCANGFVYMIRNALTTVTSFQSTGAPSTMWVGSDISATGQFVVVAGSNVGIYISYSFGNSFTSANAPFVMYTSVTCSSSGQYMAATYKSPGGGIYYSNNFGATWVLASSAPAGYYTGVSSSSSGKYMYASTYPGRVYMTSDFGQTWSTTPTVPTTMPTPSPGVNGRSLLYQNWTCVATSSSGQYVYATQGTGFIYQSNDQGTTFTLSSAPTSQWTAVSASTSGQVVAASINLGSIYVSRNYGASWQASSSLNLRWYSVAVSQTGQNMTACVYGGTIYTSNNYGASWTGIGQGYNQYWFAVAMSLNAMYQAAVVYGDYGVEGDIYVANVKATQWTMTRVKDIDVNEVLTSVAVSGTGQYMTVGGFGGPLYYSSSYGKSWFTSGSLLLNWFGVAMSSSGQYQVAGTYGNNIYYSSNYGQTWTNSNSPLARWVSCAASSAGNIMYCVAQGQSIAKSTDYGVTWSVLTGTAVPSAGPTRTPSLVPTRLPTFIPSRPPTFIPSAVPTESPTAVPTTRTPTFVPTYIPSMSPSTTPTVAPTVFPTAQPSHFPTALPTFNPTADPTIAPSVVPTVSPSTTPTEFSTFIPTTDPSMSPSCSPTFSPSQEPSVTPTFEPTVTPSEGPTPSPTRVPSAAPSHDPSAIPTHVPSFIPTADPSMNPSCSPTVTPSQEPSVTPTFEPTVTPSEGPTPSPTITPSAAPSHDPSAAPSTTPTYVPSIIPSEKPSQVPTMVPSVSPTVLPSTLPTFEPTAYPTFQPTTEPTATPTCKPPVSPSQVPSYVPSRLPSHSLTEMPSVEPTQNPSVVPTIVPSYVPTVGPSGSPYQSSLQPTLLKQFPYMPTHQPIQQPPTLKPATLQTSQPSLEPKLKSFRPYISIEVSDRPSPEKSDTNGETIHPTLQKSFEMFTKILHFDSLFEGYTDKLDINIDIAEYRDDAGFIDIRASSMSKHLVFIINKSSTTQGIEYVCSCSILGVCNSSLVDCPSCMNIPLSLIFSRNDFEYIQVVPILFLNDNQCTNKSFEVGDIAFAVEIVASIYNQTFKSVYNPSTEPTTHMNNVHTDPKTALSMLKLSTVLVSIVAVLLCLGSFSILLVVIGRCCLRKRILPSEDHVPHSPMRREVTIPDVTEIEEALPPPLLCDAKCVETRRPDVVSTNSGNQGEVSPFTFISVLVHDHDKIETVDGLENGTTFSASEKETQPKEIS